MGASDVWVVVLWLHASWCFFCMHGGASAACMWGPRHTMSIAAINKRGGVRERCCQSCSLRSCCVRGGALAACVASAADLGVRPALKWCCMT